MHRLPDVVTTSVLRHHHAVHLRRGDVVLPGQVNIEKAYVAAEVQVDLRSVIEDKDLAVLVRVHRARVDIQVGVDLDGTDLQSLRLQQHADRGGADALPEA